MIRKLLATVAVLALGLTMMTGMSGCSDETAVDAPGDAQRRPEKEPRPAPGPGGSGLTEKEGTGEGG